MIKRFLMETFWSERLKMIARALMQKLAILKMIPESYQIYNLLS